MENCPNAPTDAIPEADQTRPIDGSPEQLNNPIDHDSTQPNKPINPKDADSCSGSDLWCPICISQKHLFQCFRCSIKICINCFTKVTLCPQCRQTPMRIVDLDGEPLLRLPSTTVVMISGYSFERPSVESTQIVPTDGVDLIAMWNHLLSRIDCLSDGVILRQRVDESHRWRCVLGTPVGGSPPIDTNGWTYGNQTSLNLRPEKIYDFSTVKDGDPLEGVYQVLRQQGRLEMYYFRKGTEEVEGMEEIRLRFRFEAERLRGIYCVHCNRLIKHGQRGSNPATHIASKEHAESKKRWKELGPELQNLIIIKASDNLHT